METLILIMVIMYYSRVINVPRGSVKSVNAYVFM